jgi:hypothetical protein
MKAQGLGVTVIAEVLGIGRASVYRVPEDLRCFAACRRDRGEGR